jgi:hypothetical protein
MSDDPFAAFKEGQAPAPETKPARKKREKKAPAERPPAKAAADKPKKARKPRQAKELKLPISTLLEIGSLSDEESGALLSIGAGLQKLPKKSRQRIATALGKIFG